MNVGIIGASGYVGGELLRLLIKHPRVDVNLATSRRYAGEFVYRIHPNLRGWTKLKFTAFNPSKATDTCDLLFIATPHGVSSTFMPEIIETGIRVIDTSADFRLKDPKAYIKWYGWEHSCPELLEKAVYGLPELHRDEIRRGQIIACPGCMAAAAILALAPIAKHGGIEKNRVIVDFKVGSSGGGAKPSLASHHPEHFGVIRPYKPVGHRHTAEIEQELSMLSGEKFSIAMSAHAVNIVRGILATCHLFLTKQISLVNVWRIYRQFYGGEPFIRLVREKKGIYRYPDPKVVVGSNYCDIGFELDINYNRLVLLSALDNLMKGAAGTAVQDMNIMFGWDEKEGLWDLSLHPI
ncbi:MAG TPA: N-acetyl-gamma-glutamyl-phosphate reductase [Candidatus Bathyarchaeota archaeon]|nr:N-acetyl-gamma-glutamyl-phosphate reductase [Candidatus Bathyarchaeota archaeon]